MEGRVPAGRDALRALRAHAGLKGSGARALGVVGHAFSHFRQELHVFAVRAAAARWEGEGWRFAEPGSLPLTTAARRALALAE